LADSGGVGIWKTKNDVLGFDEDRILACLWWVVLLVNWDVRRRRRQWLAEYGGVGIWKMKNDVLGFDEDGILACLLWVVLLVDLECSAKEEAVVDIGDDASQRERMRHVEVLVAKTL
jgi:hypothetical protein